LAIYDPILMKFGTQVNDNMLSIWNLSLMVWRHFTRWPPPPCWKSIKKEQ
jgi:hypothetical protein